MNEVDVVVIGAGAAGLAAAERLTRNHMDIVVLEARERTGGRAFTVSTPRGELVDLGCHWLHSSNVNPFMDIARELHFTVDTISVDWNRRIANLHGEQEQN